MLPPHLLPRLVMQSYLPTAYSFLEPLRGFARLNFEGKCTTWKTHIVSRRYVLVWEHWKTLSTEGRAVFDRIFMNDFITWFGPEEFLSSARLT